MSVLFNPVRGTEAGIAKIKITDGNVYYAIDSGKMYIDADKQRIAMGAAGAAIYYGDAKGLVMDESTGYYTITSTDVKGTPKIGDLILNSDGGFYKVEILGEGIYICTLLSISGTGGGGAIEVQTRPVITKLELDSYSLINGSTSYFNLEANSAFINDVPIDETIRVQVTLGTKTSVDSTVLKPYWTTTLIYQTAGNGYFDKYGVGVGYVKDRIEFGSKLRESSTSYLVVQVLAGGHDLPSKTRGEYDPITTSVLELKQISSYEPSNVYSVSGFNLQYNVNGAIDKKIKMFFDGVAMKPTGTGSNTDISPYTQATWTPTFAIPAGKYTTDGEGNRVPVLGTATHGHHTVEVQLCQLLNGEEGEYVAPLKYEICVANKISTEPPIIWLGDYKETYYTYDTIQIPFFVYDPAHDGEAVDVHLYKNNIEQDGSPQTIEPSTQWNLWEIVDADFQQQNKYQISCGEDENRQTMREIRFTVVEDENRKDFVTETADLMVNFAATGRTNAESAAKRQTWSYDLAGVTKYATFTDFNWRNNGWTMDSEINQSCLRISNGAKFSIPYQQMIFGSTTAEQQSHSVELQFRITNVQKYNKLISNITRYKNDTAWYNAFKAQTKYANYDAYLQATLTPDEYEGLVFDKVQKIINVDNIVGGLYDYDKENNTITGFCIGTQDAFFSNGQDTVNVDFVENDLVNLSFVYQHGLKNLYIYINGCITGVIKSSIDDGKTFVINSGSFDFNSNSCDIDLYKLRIYRKNLGVNHIVRNFAVDRKDVVTFDMIGLATENTALQEYQIQYANVESYIQQNPDKPLMPYIVFDTGNIDSRLPYSKKDKKNITVEFVNVPLEQAYKDGRLEELASADGLYNPNTATPEQITEAVKTYYKHHCPSFTSSIRSSDKVDFEVQGTSSEFYPRRNYKVKTKVEGNFNWKDNSELDPEDQNEELGGAYTEEEALNLFMNRGPFAEDFAADQAMVEEDNKKLGYETTRLVDGWYMNNYTNATDRWTLKVDYMESSGSYNAGFASWVGNSYTKHPLQDYLGVLSGTGELKPIVKTTVCDDDGMRWEDYRTSLMGFPVMAFWKRGTDGKDAVYTFIGYYRMLLDKSSTSVLGFKTPKKVYHKLFPAKYNDDGTVKEYTRLRDIAECWEFSNNARGFCSYRDPWNRVELSFKAPKGVANEYTADGAPVVANSFEYRYHSKDDFIDVLYKFDEATQTQLDEVADELGLPEGSIIAGEANRETGADALLTTHANWEKVCKWLWSTNLDAVDSQGTYVKVPVGNVLYKDDGSFFIIDDSGAYVATTGQPFDPEKEYYKYKKDASGNIVYEKDDEGNDKVDAEGNPIPMYEVVDATTEEYLYVKGKFYYQAAGLDTESISDDVYAISNDDYDGTTDYYNFVEGDEATFDNRFDLLVRPVDTNTEAFDASGTYYTWHGTDYDVNDESNQVVIKPGSPTGAVQVVNVPTQEEWATGKYYVINPVTYAGKTYTHDTKEYRIAKFTNEFEKHFDPEYVATYFIMTEVMECYDSRGKNCMMASWGPQAEGGEYIWYPIFYDIDTQLGINNTGIPSFEYNVDATEANNYSTSDSILWNNFYRFFKKTWMLPKYQNLRKITTSKFEPLLERDKTTSKAPLQSVDYIEKWYNFNPDMTHNIACEGAKPLIATNLDMYFKYITITNAKAKEQGVAHLNDAGEYSDPDPGTYFYALQGDRSQSRRQFLTNRLEYIDSWLTQGNYARGGANRLWGRISANNTSGTDVHSDKWVEDSNAENSYWIDNEFGTKRHEFDAEYWLELKPIRSSYVTAGDDSANYPSQKYDGINQLYFTLNELENGIRRSNNYPEQLLYIYGTNQMSDFGDLSKMYWTEFKLEGEANRLTRLKLGHDGLDVDGGHWYNRKLNGITLPALPLLKEANFCNINITADNKALDLSSSEKLENFRATGSNLSSVKFADGVALNTLYIPSTIASLTLKEASLLTDLITSYEPPEKDDNGNLVAKEGLYIEGLFEESSSDSQFKFIELDGGALGYNSYTIVNRLYDKGSAGITLKNVKWCPYTTLTEGDIFEIDKTYFKDNGHYGFVEYEPIVKVADSDTFNADCDYYTLSNNKYTAIAITADNFASNKSRLYAFNRKQFNADILSGILYREDGFGGRNEDGSFSDLVTAVNDNTITMLNNFVSNSSFTNAASLSNPDITGIIYIHNTSTSMNESDIVDLQTKYPNLTFFFANVNKAYSAKFVIFNPDDYSEKYVKWQNGSTSPSVQKIQSYSATTYFTSPFELYKPEKTHYDFKGWSLDDRHPYDENGNLLSSVITQDNPEAWNEQTLVQDKYDYTYYAIFDIHSYNLNFYDDTGTIIENVIKIPYGEWAVTPDVIPYKDDSQLSLYETYNFTGYSSRVGGDLVDVSTIKVTSDEDFYAIFEKVDDVRTIVHPEYFTATDVWTYDEQGLNIGSAYTATGVSITPIVILKGKITIPRMFNGKPVIGIGGFGNTSGDSAHAVTHIFMELADDNSKSSLCVITNNTFRNVRTLKYFDFGGSNLRQVQSFGFSGCNLDADLIDLRLAPLQYVAVGGFNQSITSSKATTLFIPACLKAVGNTGFSNLKMASGSNMEIGSEDDESLLDLGLNSTQTAYYKFTQNQHPFSKIYFYSDKYNDKLDPVTSESFDFVVEDFFIDPYSSGSTELIVY